MSGDFLEIFLVPGFLGFQQLGKLEYFIDVEQELQRKFEGKPIEVRVHSLGAETPAGSLRLRAAHLAREVARLHSRRSKAVHFVGHSTGGLDIRLLLSPGSSVGSGRDLGPGGILAEEEQLTDAELQNLFDALEKTESIVSVATPHRGSPIANTAMRIDFDRILKRTHHALDDSKTAERLAKALKLANQLTKRIEPRLPKGSFLKWIITKVLSQPPEKLIRYIQQAGADVGALRNLTQEGMNLASALLIDRPGVRYGSIITGTPQGWTIDSLDVFIGTSTFFFWVARHITGRKNPDYSYAEGNEILARYRKDLDRGCDVGEIEIDERTSDGVVPTLSQAYGKILGVFASDHLDCVGHFPHKQADGTKVPGWVRSGADFNSDRHKLLWGRVAKFIANEPLETLVADADSWSGYSEIAWTGSEYCPPD